MLKKVLSVALVATVAGCACLPGLPKCWLCAVGTSLADTIFGPSGVVGTLISDLLAGLVPAT